MPAGPVRHIIKFLHKRCGEASHKLLCLSDPLSGAGALNRSVKTHRRSHSVTLSHQTKLTGNTMASPRLTPLVESLPSTVPFIGPETLELKRGKPFSARIGANESSFGPAPSVIEAMRQEASEVWKYGDP